VAGWRDGHGLEEILVVMNVPPHPADFLNDVLMPAIGRSDGEIARLLGISLPIFYTILTREKPISPATAGMLGRLFNTGEDFWLKMQAEFDRHMAPQNVVDGGVVPPESRARPSLAGPGMQARHLPRPPIVTYPEGTDGGAPTDFTVEEVVPWGRQSHDSDRSSFG
jgi:addiction module HigA family antidote